MGILDFLSNSVKTVVSGLETAAKKSVPAPVVNVNSTPITPGVTSRVPNAPVTPDLKSLMAKPIQSILPPTTSFPTVAPIINKPIAEVVRPTGESLSAYDSSKVTTIPPKPQVNIVPPPVRKQDFKDVIDFFPILGGYLAKGVVDPSLSLYQAVSGKTAPEVKVPLPYSDKKHGEYALESETSQKFYTDQLDKGVDPGKAFWNTAIKTGLDMSQLVGLGEGLTKLAILKTSPEKFISPEIQNYTRENLRDYFSGRKTVTELNFPKELRENITNVIENGTLEDKRKLFKGVDMLTAKPSILGKAFGVTEEEATNLLHEIHGGPIREAPAGYLPGYRSEPGQAPAFGLSTERVEPVGFHDYKEPSIDVGPNGAGPENVKSVLSKPINEVVGTAKVGDTTISIKKGGKISIPEPTSPGLFDKAKPPVYEGEKDLTVSTLEKLKGRSTVSKTFIDNLTNQPDLKQTERDIIREKLNDYPDGSQVPVAEFAKKVKAELLPLKRLTNTQPQYESITLSDSERGNISNYSEHIYSSPVKTSAGGVHFGRQENTSGYFGHTRVEDLANKPAESFNRSDLNTPKKLKDFSNGTRRVIEVQSDLYQKGNLEREIKLSKGHSNPEYLQEKAKEMSKLSQYNDPTAHFRMVREEIKKAAEDGITKLQFPTGETAMKIEGLGGTHSWSFNDRETSLTPDRLKVGMKINQGLYPSDEWIVTDVLGDGKFKAVPKQFADTRKAMDQGWTKENIADFYKIMGNSGHAETFDISGKVDTSNPIYKFYEKDLGRYLKNKYGAEVVTDKQGVKWYEVPVTKDMSSPVTAFKNKVPFLSPLRGGKNLPLDEITRLIYKDIPQSEVRLIFTDELINGRAIGEYSKSKMEGNDWYKPVLKPIIRLYTENGLASLDAAYHESGHYIFDNFLSKAEKTEVIDLAKKEVGPLSRASYKLKGYASDKVAEEYLMDEYAKAKAKGGEYDPKYKSFFDKLDSILKRIVDTYKKVMDRVNKFFEERGGSQGGYIKNPLTEEPNFEDRPNARKINELAPEDASIRNKTASQELANKQYLRTAKSEAEVNLPKDEVLAIRRQENEVRTQYLEKPAEAEKALSQIMNEMDASEKGSRTMVGSGPDAKFIASPSTFPKWVPEDLRSKKLFDAVTARVDSLLTLHYPHRTVSLREARLINEIYNQIDQRLGVDTSSAREGITSAYTAEGRLQARDEKSLGKFMERAHKQTAKVVREEEATKQHLERVKKADEEATKKLADEALYKSTLQEKINKAKAEGTKAGSLWNKIQAKLKPIEGLDKTTKDLTKRWLDHKWGIKEIANEEYRRVKPFGPQTFKEVLDYQAGKKTPYIRKAFDDMNTEFKRRGLDFNYLEDYVPQVWTAPEGGFQNVATQYLKEKGMTDDQIKDYLSGKPLENSTALRLKLRPSFVKERFWPDYQTGMEHGLKPKYKSPAELIAHYREQGEQSINNRDYIESLRSEAKLLPPDDAPDTWEPVTSRFSRERLYARPELARMLNGVFRDEDNLDLIPWLTKGASKVAKFMFDMRTMAGVPNTTINSFAIGQANRLLYSALGATVSGDLKSAASDLRASFAFIRANSNQASSKWFSDNQEYLLKMSDNGIGIGRYPGSYDSVSRKIGDVITSLPKGSSIIEKVGAGLKNTGRGASYLFDKFINEKTMRSMMSQITVQTFKDTYTEALAKGLPEKEATKFAVDVTKKLNGILGNVGRSEGTSEGLQTVFAAPYFRESVIGTLFNSSKGWSSEFNNPTFKKSRQFIVGLIISYGIYNYLNKKLNGNYMWDNAPGHEFDLRVPFPNGDIAYIKFGPSFFAIARNLGSAAINTATGNFDVAAQKIGSLFSTPIELLSELYTNRDYFGRAIYKTTDTGYDKLKKIAAYAGLSVNHPFIQETYKYINGDQPLYQALIRMSELPATFGSADKEQVSKYYDALDKKAAERVQAKKPIQKIYDSNQKLKAEGKVIEANQIYNSLPPADRKLYDSIKQTEKTKATNSRKPVIQGIYDSNQELIATGKLQEATRIYLNLSPEDRHVYDLVKKANQK